MAPSVGAAPTSASLLLLLLSPPPSSSQLSEIMQPTNHTLGLSLTAVMQCLCSSNALQNRTAAVVAGGRAKGWWRRRSRIDGSTTTSSSLVVVCCDAVQHTGKAWNSNTINPKAGRQELGCWVRYAPRRQAKVDEAGRSSTFEHQLASPRRSEQQHHSQPQSCYL